MGICGLKNKTNKNHHRILHICIGLCSEFQLKLTFFLLDQICSKKGIPSFKQILWTSYVLLIRISLGSKFQPKLTILIFLDQIFSKRVFPVLNRKSEHNHWVLFIQITLTTKFQRSGNFDFLDQIYPKRLLPF